jgi:hypothetical protein
MSTRALIGVKGSDVYLYRHCDGYPETNTGVLFSLIPLAKKFAEKRNDPDYFMARLVENQINATKQQDDLIGFGLFADKSIDHQFLYIVDLTARTISINDKKIIVF